MRIDGKRERGRAGRLVLGLILVLAGGALLAQNAGLIELGPFWSWWPFFLIGLGATKLLWPGDGEERGSGYWLVVVGLYGWISTRHLFGLSWSTAWPIALLAIGLQIALESLDRGRAQRPAREEAARAE